MRYTQWKPAHVLEQQTIGRAKWLTPGLDTCVTTAHTIAANAAGRHVVPAGASTEFARQHMIDGQLTASKRLIAVLAGEHVAQKHQWFLRTDRVTRHPIAQVVDVLAQDQHRRYRHADARTVYLPIVVVVQRAGGVEVEQLDGLLPGNR